MIQLLRLIECRQVRVDLEIAKPINLPSLSREPRGRYACSNTSPTVALKTLEEDWFQTSKFMSPSELPRLFTLLAQDGYHVDTALTQIMGMQHTNLGNWTDPSVSGKLVCYVTRG